jgi:hypothetical protein
MCRCANEKELIMGLFERFFKSKKDNTEHINDNSQVFKDEETLVKNFIRSGNSDRIRIVMKFGDSAMPEYYPVLKYAILNDANIDVKFAALKRIHLFKDNPDVVLLLNNLNTITNIEQLEPYYSMALSRVGIITIDQFNEKLNPGS